MYNVISVLTSFIADRFLWQCPITVTSPPQSHLGRAASPPLTAENGLARCVC